MYVIGSISEATTGMFTINSEAQLEAFRLVNGRLSLCWSGCCRDSSLSRDNCRSPLSSHASVLNFMSRRPIGNESKRRNPKGSGKRRFIGRRACTWLACLANWTHLQLTATATSTSAWWRRRRRPRRQHRPLAKIYYQPLVLSSARATSSSLPPSGSSFWSPMDAAAAANSPPLKHA